MNIFVKISLISFLVCFVSLEKNLAQQSTPEELHVLSNTCTSNVKSFLDQYVTTKAARSKNSKIILIGRAEKAKNSLFHVRQSLKLYKNYLSVNLGLADRVLTAKGEIGEKAIIPEDSNYIEKKSRNVGRIEVYVKGEIYGIILLKRIKKDSDYNKDCLTDGSYGSLN